MSFIPTVSGLAYRLKNLEKGLLLSLIITAMRVRYCKILFLLTLSSLFFSCEKKQDHRLTLVALQAACTDKWAKIEAISNQMQGLVAKEGNRKVDLNILNESQRISNWKKTAIEENSVIGLKAYLDSIIYLSNDSTINSLLRNLAFDSISMNFDLIQQDIRKMPPRLKTPEDSVKFYQILYLTLRRELQIHIGLISRLDDFLPSQIRRSKTKYNPGDTVKIIIPLSRYEVSNVKFHAQLVKLYFSSTPSNLNENVLEKLLQAEFIGGVVLYKFPVLEKGFYRLKGPVYVQYPESKQKEVIEVVDQLFEIN